MQLPPPSPSRSTSGSRPGSNSKPQGGTGLGGKLQRGLQLFILLLMGLFALGLMLAALATGVVLTLGVVAWSLLRGRKPSLDTFHTVYRRARNTRAAGPWRREDGTRAGAGEVVDIEAREVTEARSGHRSHEHPAKPDSADPSPKS